MKVVPARAFVAVILRAVTDNPRIDSNREKVFVILKLFLIRQVVNHALYIRAGLPLGLPD